MKKNTIIEIIASCLIFLFLYASISKFLDYSAFRLQLGKSPFINGFAPVIAWVLPTIEIIISLLLLFRKTRISGLYASLFIMTFFTSYVYAMLHFSYYLPCSCGGVLSKMSWNQHLIFNIFFVALSIAGIYCDGKSSMKKIIRSNIAFE